MKIFFILLMVSSLSYAKSNVSLSKLLVKFQGNEYNLLLSPKHIVMSSKKKKTRKAINKGYKRAVSELMRLMKMRDLDLNMKAFKSSGSNLEQYLEADSKTYTILKDMLVAQVTLSESFKEDEELTQVSTESVNPNISADDINMDLGDDAFDITEDKAVSGSMINVSPAEAFTTSFVEMSELYNEEVLELSKTLHPFNIKGKPKMKNIHSVFGMAFFPTKKGAIKNMRIYIVLCNINSEQAQSVQIISKEVGTFRWDRNHLYISGATGKILRQIVSGVLGESFL